MTAIFANVMPVDISPLAAQGKDRAARLRSERPAHGEMAGSASDKTVSGVTFVMPRVEQRGAYFGIRTISGSATVGAFARSQVLVVTS